MLESCRSPIELDAVVDEAVGALTVLDVAKLEALCRSLDQAKERIRLPQSALERQRTASRRWILAHLIGETRRRLEMLHRVSTQVTRFGPYCGCMSPPRAAERQPQI